MEQNVIEKQRLFLSLVETMSLFQRLRKQKDKLFYARTFVSATDLMIDLHDQGAKEENTHSLKRL